MEGSDTCAALKSDGLLLWKTEQAKGPILEGDGEDMMMMMTTMIMTIMMTMTRPAVKRLCNVCHVC